MERRGGMGVAPGDRLGYNLSVLRARQDGGLEEGGGFLPYWAAQYAGEKGGGQMEDNERELQSPPAAIEVCPE